MRLLLVACATTTARALSTSSSVRLDKFLNDASVAASRAACSKLVKQGRVAVDGVVAKRAAAKVPADARVTVDDVLVEPLPLLWALLLQPGLRCPPRAVEAAAFAAAIAGVALAAVRVGDAHAATPLR